MKDYVLQFSAFGLTLLCALLFQWEAKDLIWGLWVSSLCVGYAFIVKTIIFGVLSARRTTGLPLALFGGICMLLFFTFHFGMFHFVHSVFLNLFFPLTGNRQEFPDIFYLITTTISLYWPVVLANLIVKFEDFRLANVDLRNKDAFAKPYVNVVKIHVLIFIFAGLSALHLTRLALYPILFFFFFPWGVWRNKKAGSVDEKN